jgi:hypothetical protein
MLFFLVSLSWLLLVTGNADGRLKVFHRLYVPREEDAQWSVRGHIDGQDWVPEAKADLTQFTLGGRSIHPGGLYQIALERDGDKSSRDWDVSSVPAVCGLYFILVLYSNATISVISTLRKART